MMKIFKIKKIIVSEGVKASFTLDDIFFEESEAKSFCKIQKEKLLTVLSMAEKTAIETRGIVEDLSEGENYKISSFDGSTIAWEVFETSIDELLKEVAR